MLIRDFPVDIGNSHSIIEKSPRSIENFTISKGILKESPMLLGNSPITIGILLVIYKISQCY